MGGGEVAGGVEKRTLSAKVVRRSLGVPLMATEGTGFGGRFVVGGEKGLEEKVLVLQEAGEEKGFSFVVLAEGDLTPNMLLPRVCGIVVVGGFV